MKTVLSLSEHLKKNEELEIFEKKADDTVKRLIKLLDISVSETKRPSSVLCILAELVYIYYDDPPANIRHSTNEAHQLFNHIANYNNGSNQKKKSNRNYIHKHCTSKDIHNFFEFFYANIIWEEEDRYDSSEEFYDTLEYLNDYAYVFFLWETSRQPPESEYNFDEDIKNFALALYDRKKLPKEYRYEQLNEGLREVIGFEPPHNIESIKKVNMH